MTLINWSDPEEMLGLLTEYVADERRDAAGDRERERFLSSLLRELTALNERLTTLSMDEATQKLRIIRDSLNPEFGQDPVVDHLEACIEEVDRIRKQDT